MFTPQQLVWNGQLPVRFDLASNEVTTYQAPRPLFVMIPRVSYFPLLLARVVEYFEKYAPPMLGVGSDDAQRKRIRNVWFESNGIPLRWHLPVGVLYDVLMKPKQCQLEEEEHMNDTTNNNNNNNTILPWKIVVHFQSFPEQQIVRFDGLDSVRWNFMSDLKQAMYVRLRSAKSVLDLPKQEQEQMWEGLKINDSLKFWQINSKLIGGSGSNNNDEIQMDDSTNGNDNKNNTKLQRLPIRILVVTTLNNKKQNDNNSPLSINNGMNSNDDFNIYQRPINAYQTTNDGTTLDFTKPNCIGHALIECVPKYLNYTLNDIVKENENNKLRFIIHGIEVSPFDNLIKACDILPHADNFLYLIIIDNVV